MLDPGWSKEVFQTERTCHTYNPVTLRTASVSVKTDECKYTVTTEIKKAQIGTDNKYLKI
jgi:hypothetical protein